MPVVFVHGNPETDAIWRPLLSALAARGIGDTVLLSPPGFGVASPIGWHASVDAYAAWLVDELEAVAPSGPIDLVGHDWGAGHVLGALVRRPDLVRSWAIDVAALIHPDHEWHDAAQAWQTPGVGEDVIDAMVGADLTDRTAMFGALGMPDEIAAELATGLNADMGRCVLTLYRDAAQPTMRELGERVFAAQLPPAAVVHASDDAYVASRLTSDVADRLDAHTISLDGRGHWWMVEAPDEAADGLVGFWSSL